MNMKNIYLTIIVLSFGLVACSTLTPKEEEDASIRTINWLDNKFGFINDSFFNKYADKVMLRLAGGVRGSRLWKSERKRSDSYNWQLYMLNIEQPNAFSVGSGVVVISRGLLVKLESEAQLAYVISHEMAHQILGHTSEAILESKEQNISPAFHFSLSEEMAADELGLEIMKQAKYDPRHALAAFTIAYSRTAFNAPNHDPQIISEWLDARGANLKQLVAEIAPNSLGLENTRDFNKLRFTLASFTPPQLVPGAMK